MTGDAFGRVQKQLLHSGGWSHCLNHHGRSWHYPRHCVAAPSTELHYYTSDRDVKIVPVSKSLESIQATGRVDWMHEEQKSILLNYCLWTSGRDWLFGRDLSEAEDRQLWVRMERRGMEKGTIVEEVAGKHHAWDYPRAKWSAVKRLGLEFSDPSWQVLAGIKLDSGSVCI